VVLTVGEILVSVTGLEFAYTQAPLTMKSVIQSFWNLTTAARTWRSRWPRRWRSSPAPPVLYYAGFAYLAAVGLALVARRYKIVEWYQRAPARSSGARAGARSRAGLKSCHRLGVGHLPR